MRSSLAALAVAAAVFCAVNARAGAGDDAFDAYTAGHYSRALELAKPAAATDDFMARFVLARVYEEGKGAAQDKTESGRWFQKALDLAQPAAEGGDASAQFIVGRMHQSGWLLSKDDAQAASWYLKSAEQGYAAAQTNLGSMYVQGQGVAKNPAAGLSLIRKAADQGMNVAQLSLGALYLEGIGAAKNPVEALSWFRKAADQGFAPAQYYVGSMYTNGLGTAKNEEEGAAWLRKSVDQGYAQAQYDLATQYWQGRGVAKNLDEAFSLYRKAAEQGFAPAQASLGYMYAEGQGVSKSLSEALVWHRKAAEQGNTIAQYNLGRAYDSGLGTSVNPVDAAVWYRKSADQGYPAAQYSIGFDYEEGRGVTKDESQAAKWYQLAADQDFVPAARTHHPGDLWDDARATRFERKKSSAPAAVAAAPAAAPAEPVAPHSDVDSPGYSAPENANNFAVVVGVEKYASLPAADFAERDAEAVRAHLMASGYPARNIYFLDGERATRAKLAQALNTWLPARVGANSTVFFYYSGHGAPDPQTHQAYLVPVDGDAEDLDSTAYPTKLMYEKLGKLKAKHVIVALDSCFSGAGGRSVIAKGTRPLVSKIELGSLPANVIALTASDKNQTSGTMDEQGHGAFTYYFLKGLSGAAKSSDGHVTVQSLYDYLSPKVQDAARLHNRDQAPQLQSAAPHSASSQIRLR